MTLRTDEKVHARQLPLCLRLVLTSAGLAVGKERWMESGEGRMNRNSQGELQVRGHTGSHSCPSAPLALQLTWCGWTAEEEAGVLVHRAPHKLRRDLEKLKEVVWQELEMLRAQVLPHHKENQQISCPCGLHQHWECKKVVASSLPSCKFMQNVTCDPR